jgi:transposase-like protein
MAKNSTLYEVVESILENQGTSFSVFVPDLLDEGLSYEDVTYRLRERTNVQLSSRTIRRWVEKQAAA